MRPFLILKFDVLKPDTAGQEKATQDQIW